MTSLLDQANISIDDNVDYLSELVGEGKKFKDTAALARGKKEADDFIESLKRENSTLRQDYDRIREEYNAVPRLQELVDQLANTQVPPSSNNLGDDGNTAALNPEQIQELVDQMVSKKVQETKTKDQEDANFRTVQAKLKERYGDAAANALKSQIESLGLTEEFANDLARRHPAVFMKTFGLDDPKQDNSFQAPPVSTNRPSFTNNTQKRDWKFYEDMRKSNYDLYRDPKTQVQMHKDYMEQGEAFGLPAQ